MTTIGNFIVSNPADFEVNENCRRGTNGGLLFLSDFTAGAAIVSCRAILPRSIVTNKGSRLDSVIVNYKIQLGAAISFSAALTREVWRHGEIKNKNTKNERIKNPSPAFALISSKNFADSVVDLRDNVFDNNDKDSITIFNFSLSINAAADIISGIRLTEILIASVTFRYTQDISVDGAAAIVDNILNVCKEIGEDKDERNRGSLHLPFRTISAAVTQAAALLEENKDTFPHYIVQVGPGEWIENITLPKNIFIRGIGGGKTIIRSTISLGRSAEINNRGFIYCTFISPAGTQFYDINFRSASAAMTKLHFIDCIFINDAAAGNNTVSISVTAADLTNTIKFIGGTMTNVNVSINGCDFQMMGLTLNNLTMTSAASNTDMNNLLFMKDCSGTYNITLSSTNNIINTKMMIGEFINCIGPQSTLSLSGRNTTANIVSSTWAAGQPTVANSAAVSNGNSLKNIATIETFREECWVTAAKPKMIGGA